MGLHANNHLNFLCLCATLNWSTWHFDIKASVTLPEMASRLPL